MFLLSGRKACIIVASHVDLHPCRDFQRSECLLRFSDLVQTFVLELLQNQDSGTLAHSPLQC